MLWQQQNNSYFLSVAHLFVSAHLSFTKGRKCPQKSYGKERNRDGIKSYHFVGTYRKNLPKKKANVPQYVHLFCFIKLYICISK